MSAVIPHQELPDYIIPTDYYDRYRLVFSHYHLDSKIARIGKNEKQKRSNQKIAFDNRLDTEVLNSWNSFRPIRVSREADYIRDSGDQSALHQLHTQVRAVNK